MTLGYGFPMGPLKLTDLVGLDVRLSIAEYLAKQARPGRPLRAAAAAARHGRRGQARQEVGPAASTSGEPDPQPAFALAEALTLTLALTLMLTFELAATRAEAAALTHAIGLVAGAVEVTLDSLAGVHDDLDVAAELRAEPDLGLDQRGQVGLQGPDEGRHGLGLGGALDVDLGRLAARADLGGGFTVAGALGLGRAGWTSTSQRGAFQLPSHLAWQVASHDPVQVPLHSPTQRPCASLAEHSPWHSPVQVPSHEPPQVPWQ